MLTVENNEQAVGIKGKIVERWQQHVGNTERYLSNHINRNLSMYCSLLPKIFGKTVEEYIKERLLGGAETLTVLDIGCGQGICLAELVKNHPQIRAVGLTAADFRNKPTTYDWQPYIEKIDYRLGDAHQLTEVLGDITPDVVVSLYAFQYFADPLSVLEQTYELSAEGAVIFIDSNNGLDLTREEAKQLENIWQQSGIEFNLESMAGIDWKERYHYRLALQKGAASSLPLPFRYSFDESGVPRVREYLFQSS